MAAKIVHEQDPQFLPDNVPPPLFYSRPGVEDDRKQKLEGEQNHGYNATKSLGKFLGVG